MGGLFQGGSQKTKMNDRKTAILEHLKKYTLTDTQLMNMSDIEIMTHSREAKIAMNKINEDFPPEIHQFK